MTLRFQCFLGSIAMLAAFSDQETMTPRFRKVGSDDHYLIVSNTYSHTKRRNPSRTLQVCQHLPLPSSDEESKKSQFQQIPIRLYPLRGGGRGLAPDPEDDSDVGSDWFPAEEQDKPYDEEKVAFEENNGDLTGDFSESHHSSDKWELKPFKVGTCASAARAHSLPTSPPIRSVRRSRFSPRS